MSPMKSPRIKLATHSWSSYSTTAELSSHVTNSLTVSFWTSREHMARRPSCDYSRIEQAGVYPSPLLLRLCFLLDLVLQLL